MAPSYLSAFVVGMLGGVHCFGMCGGVVGVLTLSLPADVRERFLAMAPYLLAYNVGRITSYVVAGSLVGGVGAWAANLGSVRHGQQVLQLLAGAFMVMLGLYLAGLWHGLTHVERAGSVLWRQIEPLGRRLIPVRTPIRALLMGLVWVWLPCGLVYSVLIWAMSSGGAAQGGLLMLCFGLGTLPALLAMGASAATLAGVVRKPAARRFAGAMVAAFGVYQIAIVFGVY